VVKAARAGVLFSSLLATPAHCSCSARWMGRLGADARRRARRRPPSVVPDGLRRM